jgi:peptide-methionine (S)-S-oxide reductase
METITLAGGCFWCTEAVFSQLRGVEKVTPGYSGGSSAGAPSYDEVSGGSSGFAESVQIEFDSKVIPLDKLLYVFFKLHDPTELNRQGADVGTQYRSAVFFKGEEQKKAAQIAKEEAQKDHDTPVVTEITEFTNFFPAEPEQKEFYFKHRSSPYCLFVIDPKINKLKKEFAPLLK